MSENRLCVAEYPPYRVAVADVGDQITADFARRGDAQFRMADGSPSSLPNITGQTALVRSASGPASSPSGLTCREGFDPVNHSRILARSHSMKKGTSLRGRPRRGVK